jgi:hypothetical protein
MAVVMPVAERWGEPVAAGGATSSVEPGATASGDTHARDSCLHCRGVAISYSPVIAPRRRASASLAGNPLPTQPIPPRRRALASLAGYLFMGCSGNCGVAELRCGGAAKSSVAISGAAELRCCCGRSVGCGVWFASVPLLERAPCKPVLRPAVLRSGDIKADGCDGWGDSGGESFEGSMFSGAGGRNVA